MNYKNKFIEFLDIIDMKIDNYVYSLSSDFFFCISGES